MSISAIGGSDPYALYRQSASDLKALASAVEAGDATSAQAALKTYQADVQSTNATDLAASDPLSPTSFGGQLKTDLTTLTSAVQSGDMTGAEAALKAYMQDEQSFGAQAGGPGNSETAQSNGLQGMHGSHRHHHHHGHSSSVDADAAMTTQIDETGANDSPALGTPGNSPSDPLDELLEEVTNALTTATNGVKPESI